MSATTTASLLLTLLLLWTVVTSQKTAEIVVLRYEALGYPEITALKNSFYQFSFCLCAQESSSPDRSPLCECRNGVRGKSAAESVPKALFSASCVRASNPTKCLSASFQSVSEEKTFLYIKVDIDSRTLSSPSWQLIPNSPKKTNAKISAYTRTGDIRLNYVVFSTKSASMPSTSNVFKSFSPNPKMSVFMKRMSKMKKYEVKSKKIPSYFEFKKSNVGNTMDQIKNYLLTNARAENGAPADFDLRAFRKTLTDSHNRYRSIHGAGQLDYDSAIERSAQQWANHLANEEACLKHDPVRIYGENLFFFGGSILPSAEAIAESVTKSFYIEGNGYNYNDFRPREIHRVGHFTQMVWKSSQKLGIGVAIKKSSGQRSNACIPRKGLFLIYVVVKYDPPGNVLSKEFFLDNIRPPGSG